MARTTSRYYIRYAALWWQDTLWFYGIFLLAILALIGYNGIRHMPILPLVPVAVIVVFIMIGFYLFHRASFLSVEENGLRVRNGMRSASVPYEAVARVRKLALEAAFTAPERRKYVNRFVRRLARQPAIYIRIEKRRAELAADLEKRLGRRFMHGPDLVLPIADPDAFMAEVKGRLQKTADR
jgi:hypothetical protein